jgi:hypothetical protein
VKYSNLAPYKNVVEKSAKKFQKIRGVRQRRHASFGASYAGFEADGGV